MVQRLDELDELVVNWIELNHCVNMLIRCITVNREIFVLEEIFCVK